MLTKQIENKKDLCCLCHREYTRHMMMQTRQNTYKCIRCYNGAVPIVDNSKKFVEYCRMEK